MQIGTATYYRCVGACTAVGTGSVLKKNSTGYGGYGAMGTSHLIAATLNVLGNARGVRTDGREVSGYLDWCRFSTVLAAGGSGGAEEGSSVCGVRGRRLARIGAMRQAAKLHLPPGRTKVVDSGRLWVSLNRRGGDGQMASYVSPRGLGRAGERGTALTERPACDIIRGGLGCQNGGRSTGARCSGG